MERHAILMPTADPMPTTARYQREVAAMADEARAWAEREGLKIIGLAERSQTRMADGGAAVGVSFDVVVGKRAGRGQDWSWSARVQHWAERLAPMTWSSGSPTAKLIPMDRDARTARERLGLPPMGVSGVRRGTGVNRATYTDPDPIRIPRGGIRFPTDPTPEDLGLVEPSPLIAEVDRAMDDYEAHNPD